MAQPARKRTERASSKPAPSRKSASSKKDVARQLASMIEQHMADIGLSEEEKNLRVAKFSEHVDQAVASRAKS
jgi:uncharacterized protein YjiS (DUF1127 family)